MAVLWEKTLKAIGFGNCDGRAGTCQNQVDAVCAGGFDRDVRASERDRFSAERAEASGL
jgi:hypothetical protein